MTAKINKNQRGFHCNPSASGKSGSPPTKAMETEKDLIYWVSSFYLLEDLLLRLGPHETSHARLRLREDLCARRQGFKRLLASVLFDTLVKMCFGEARHAHERCGIVIPEISSVLDRKAAYRLAEEYDPRDALPKLRDVFLECWLQPYGGTAWAIICETTLKYWSLPDEIFVDHCVDLSHHGGLVFNKIETGFHVWHKRKYLDILDLKKNSSILDIDGPLPVFSFAKDLLVRAYTLRLADGIPELKTSDSSLYRPVQWGSKILSNAVSIYDAGICR
ncbi:MAG: hypothetical protein HZB62_10480 [Nitrospirae bacterium]|nr:hypothetical protein [Nitrospirota bacterium]